MNIPNRNLQPSCRIKLARNFKITLITLTTIAISIPAMANQSTIYTDTKSSEKTYSTTETKNKASKANAMAVLPATNQIDYVYDDLGRIKQVKSNGSFIIDYQLDDMNNRVTQTQTKQP